MGNDNNGRGHPKQGREGYQKGHGDKGNGNRGRGNAQIGREVSCVDYITQCYDFPIKNEAETSYVAIPCTIHVFNQMANVLFDPDSTYFSMFVRFASNF